MGVRFVSLRRADEGDEGTRLLVNAALVDRVDPPETLGDPVRVTLHDGETVDVRDSVGEVRAALAAVRGGG